MNINELGEVELTWDERSEIMSRLNVPRSGYIFHVTRFGSVYLNGKFYGSVRPSSLTAEVDENAGM